MQIRVDIFVPVCTRTHGYVPAKMALGVGASYMVTDFTAKLATGMCYDVSLFQISLR